MQVRSIEARPLLFSFHVIEWTARVQRAVEQVGTPCYVSAWAPLAAALARLDALSSSIPVRSWLSYKTHPLPAMAAEWLRSGRGVEVVSERELLEVLALDPPIDQLLVNGVAKHTWLPRHRLPRLRVHFDSVFEIDSLLPKALEERWRVGVRVQAPDERDARDPMFRGQFGLSHREAVAALYELQAAGADVQSVHFHLGQHRYEMGAYSRAVEYVAGICEDAGVRPVVLDCGGALPAPVDASCGAAIKDLARAIRRAAACLPALREIWLENGRFISESAAALAVTVVDVKDRPDSRYLICDGGRTNHALAADTKPHQLLLLPERHDGERLTTICGPTCMADDRLGRWMLPASVDIGDLIVWLDAGAYHLPWETRFSHGLCPIVWFDADEQMSIARQREPLNARVSNAGPRESAA
jgi:diaminopimelate decarboxylase